MKPGERLMSLDALRGADMLCIMGASEVVVALCALSGCPDGWLALQMKHVAWHGFRHHDTIFPLFLFLAGVSWPFSLGFATAKFFSFDFVNTRYCNVLGHIGIGWAAAAAISLVVRGTLAKLAIIAAILAGYWALLAFTVAPDAAALVASSYPAVAQKIASYAAYGSDGFSFSGNIIGWFDRKFMPGSLHEVVFDPEGLLSSISAVATAMMGVLAGEFLRRTNLSGNRKAFVLAGAGVVCAALALAWEPWCPINKKLWTSTFVLESGAYSLTMLALFYWIVDIRGWRRWTFCFRVIGMNALAIYLLQRFVNFQFTSKFFLSGVAGLGDANWSAFVLSMGQMALGWLVLYFLYRKNVFFKV